MKEIYLKGNVPSSKNSKQWTGRMLINSKTVRNYLKDYEWQFLKNKEIFKKEIMKLEEPYNIGFYFIRDTKRKFDYSNVIQIIQDLMVKYDWIEDDNALILNPIFLGYEVNKENAGVIIKFISKKEYEFLK